jgi:2-methylcitrate dehydratase PrpD
MGETERIAQHIASLEYSSIPLKLFDEMKILLFDWLGVALGGTKTDSGRIAAEFSREMGDKGEATIIGFGDRVSAPGAAFTNAILSHSIELDDVDLLAYFHFSPPIYSAALAMAEREHSSGKDLLVALVAGCDLMARLSAATNPSLRDRGFHTTPTCGVFGAAAACAKLLHLDAGPVANTLGLAGAQSSGLMEMYGTSMQKRINPGPAARGGLVAALLASKGFTGAETIIEGERGFLQAYSDSSDKAKLVEGLGKEFPIYIEYKPYSCARPIHNAIDCALELRSKYGVKPENITAIKVERHPRWANYHGINAPRSYHEAQVSLPYAVAVAFVDGKAFLEQYSEEKLNDPLVRRLTRMVHIEPMEGLPRDVSCRMTIITSEGSSFTSQVDYPKGSIQNPLTMEERRMKFRSLAAGILDERAQQEVEERVFQIELSPDVTGLMRLVGDTLYVKGR